ncbi:unnamed protein product [Didymodactylos carnosus]|uniref:Uncharacterized protein n=1 Tax=Didymodactylos carnosus TaxID=1234261 RepID=A0A816AMF3_9BILA|nr:unnamed protein product [Didymodactylos carnosus]CAF1598276.1 unnamed protein product [Didymodactylos carnosus]CAF4255829.1 unnamed protein product [Didymodactylos carnosus]CAF4474137.1 unnamed protein product [Didymodactylos carnosus]
MKNGLVGSPSEMVDKAWHAHILNTRMYFKFSEAMFGTYLHHVPFWSDNIEEQMAYSDSEVPMYVKLKELGIQDLNETVWTYITNEHIVESERIKLPIRDDSVTKEKVDL